MSLWSREHSEVKLSAHDWNLRASKTRHMEDCVKDPNRSTAACQLQTILTQSALFT